MNFDTTQYTKITEDQFFRFIDTTPTAISPTWVLISAVEEDGARVEYNSQIDRLKLIVNKGSITNHRSFDKQMSATYLAYKEDPCFTYIEAGRDKLNYKTHILEVDLWSENNGSYKAKLSSGTIDITSYNGNTIEFNVYFDGDPEEGTVTISDKTPTFVPSVSL